VCLNFWKTSYSSKDFVAGMHKFSKNLGRYEASSYNKNQRDALISQIYFGIELYMFRTGLLLMMDTRPVRNM
jgi:hypothetical protein